ncbi:MAG TPA: hypothetical protein VKA59_10285 [Vicinamibacterales bacterium]|nr:hypothetical protein [Vicinamibacterales bacterium]
MYRIAQSTLILVVLALSAARLAAQERPVAPSPQQIPVFQETASARETREQLVRLLRQHPPAVGEVLERDPSLLTRADYLSPYPVLWAFLQKHPEIARNPSFFLGDFRYYEPGPQNTSLEMFQMILAGAGVVMGVSAFLGVFVWVVRSIIDHRRWLRLSRVQAEVHTKLLDRLTTNEDLLSYIQSPAGRRFLESAPITMEQEPRATTAPVGRIIWSLQAGLVLAALGAGFWFVQQNVSPEAAEGFFIIGVLAMSLGVGFTASALLAYVVSSRLGLVPRPKSTEA